MGEVTRVRYSLGMILRTDRPEVEALVRDVALQIRDVVGADVRILWFGSWIRGDAGERSDVDLAVAAGRELSAIEVDEIRTRIESLPTLRRVDVVDLEIVGKGFREKILGEGVPV